MVGEPLNGLSRTGGTRTGGFALLSFGLIGQIARKASRVWARQRMESVRRDPTDLVERLHRATSVLVVCHGNIIRSPFAAELLRHALGPATHVSVMSAGVDALPGRAAHPCALRVAEALHVDMSHHAASRLSQEHVDRADVIFAADLQQLTTIGRRFPAARPKTFLLACLAPRTPLEVRDPIDGDETVFARCFTHILDVVHPIARTLMTVSPQR
jgi:protein-tyrosine-phosphatase